jgi:vacuolar-type H+-ATPase subunit H
MSVNAKHIATFMLGAAVGLALSKYMNMTDDEKDKMMNDIKDKANGFREEAETAVNKAKDYFEELKTKGASAMKEHMAEAENMVNDMFGKKTSGG